MDTILTRPDDSWMMLAQPAHGHADNPRFLNLLTALDEGWEVAPPVYRRPRWIDDRDYVYHFILKHADRTGTRLITVPDDESIREFVLKNKLSAF
jgi:hypothetical protein